MDFEPDYTKYSFDDLLDIRDHINREKYPERFKRLEDEIAWRNSEAQNNTAPQRLNFGGSDGTPGSALTSAGEPVGSEMRLEFRGTAHGYFRVWIVNLCLTLLTLGIFSAWAKVRKKRFAYSHTTLDGTPFQYLAQPIPILKGRIIAGVGFLFYYMSSHFFTNLIPWVLVCGLIAAPWVIVRSVAFNARYSAFRNMTFHFKANYFGAVKTLYVWGLIPIIVALMITQWDWPAKLIIVLALAATIYFPWWLRGLKRFIIDNTYFGGRAGAFLATGGQFFGIYLVAVLIMLAFTVPLGIFFAFFVTHSTNIKILSYIAPLVGYVGYIFSYAFIKASSGNLVWNSTHLGPIHFQSTLKSVELVRLYVTNAIGIIVSLGMLIPWAVIRTWKYRADHTRVWLINDLTQFEGSEADKVSAVGAEALDFFDLDLSI